MTTSFPASSHRYRGFVESSPPVLPLLPFVHTTEGKNLNEILVARQLRVTRCKFRRELLLYLYYGRPAYRPANKASTSAELWRAVVTFVLKPSAVTGIERVFPFDSGACAEGLYQPYVDKKFGVDEFVLAPELVTPQRVVGAFYGNNQSYWEGMVDGGCLSKFDALDFHSLIYAQLNSVEHETPYDVRSGVVELQCSTAISLDVGTLEAVVVPDRLLQHPDIVKLAEDCNAKILGYRFRKERPAERVREIEKEIRDWLVATGKLAK